jgi:hypothetical protein
VFQVTICSGTPAISPTATRARSLIESLGVYDAVNSSAIPGAVSRTVAQP